MNLYEKINKIMAEVKSLQKDGKVAFGNTKYNFLSEAKTTETFREKLVENKLVLLPLLVDEKKDGQITHGIYKYRLVNAENPDEYIDLMTGGQGHDSADKGSGKASSYAYKYLLWRTFAVPSNDDPDSISSNEIQAQKDSQEDWREAEREMFDAADKIGIDFQQLPTIYHQKYGLTITDSTIAQLKKCTADMKKKAAQDGKGKK
jgi:hypothetical protein